MAYTDLELSFVAAGSRRKSSDGVRSHGVDPETGKAICGFSSPVNGWEAADPDLTTAPTCRRCAAKWPKSY